MKALGCVLLTVGLVVAVRLPAAANTSLEQHRLWTQIARFIKFHDQILPAGKYLFVHDDVKKAAGEPCLYVYSETDTTKPLIAIHCVRKAQKATESGRVVWNRLTPNDLLEFQYIQFAGEPYAHYLR